MSRGKPIQLENGKDFSTQKEARAFFKEILHSVTSKITEEKGKRGSISRNIF